MLYTELKVAIATMLNRSASDFIATEGLITVDLIDKALRAAQLKAVQEYEFESQKAQVSIVVDQVDGGLISSAVLYGTATGVDVKRLEHAFLPFDNYTRPTKIIDRSTMVNEQYRKFGDYVDETSTSYPQLDYSSEIPRVTIFGPRVFLYPRDVNNFTDPVTVNFDAIVFPSAYHATTNNSDFLSIYGEDWLFWTVVKHLNYQVKHFVPRQEGNIYNLDNEIAAGWAKLIRWDSSKTYSDAGIDMD